MPRDFILLFQSGVWAEQLAETRPAQ